MLSGVLVFLLLIIVLLAIPFTLRFKVSWQHTFQGNIDLHWAFGLVRIRMAIPESKSSTYEDKVRVQQTSRVVRSSRKKTNSFSMIWNHAFRRRMIRFIRDCWSAIHKRNVSLRIRIGLGDPADTGQLWAFVGPVSGILTTIEETTIEIEPEFLDSIFELNSSGTIRIIPLQFIYLTVALLLSPPVRQGIKQMRAGDN